MMVFHISQLDKAPVTLTGSEPPEFLELGEDEQFKAVSPVTYELTGSVVSGGVLVTGSCSVEIAGFCGRCLEPARRTVAADELRMFFEIDDRGEELDVSEDVRAELLLELPMNLLCSEECRGLCPHCGANRNLKDCGCSGPADPAGRWNALDGLKL